MTSTILLCLITKKDNVVVASDRRVVPYKAELEDWDRLAMIQLKKRLKNSECSK
jgi:hypothetical protein